MKNIQKDYSKSSQLFSLDAKCNNVCGQNKQVRISTPW